MNGEADNSCFVSMHVYYALGVQRVNSLDHGITLKSDLRFSECSGHIFFVSFEHVPSRVIRAVAPHYRELC